MPVNKISQGFVFASIGVVLISFMFSLGIPGSRLIGYSIWGIFEIWALLHAGDGDTISEAVWSVAMFPLIPWLSCFFFCYYTMFDKVITNQFEISILVGIQAHFFWQSWKVYKEING